MTTIGTAVLQIIPSLKGVTDAIEKQIDGKVVEVSVQPKVDKSAAAKAGKDAGETIAKEAKAAVSKGELGKAVGEDLKNSVKKSGAGKEIAKVVTDDVKQSSPGKDIAKVIVDGVADGVKQELGAGVGTVGQLVVDGIADGVKQGIDSGNLGGHVVESISDGIKSGNLTQKIKDTVLPGITQIGANIRSGAAEWSNDIANALRSGNIQGAASEIATSVQTTTDTIASIGSAFGADTTGVQNFGSDVAAAVQRIGDTAGTTKGQVDSVITPLQTLGNLAGPDSKMYKAAGNLPLIGAIIASLPALQQASDEMESMLRSATGLNVPLSASSVFERIVSPNFKSAADNAHQALADAQAAAEANRQPVQRGNAVPGDTYRGPGRAFGGMIPGFSTRDDRIGIIAGRSAIGLAGGEGIINARATRNLGGASTISWLNGFADGGIVPPDVAAAQALAGTGYSQGARTDCSGMVARVIDRTLGMPEAGLMSTKTAADWLAARGFVPGSGGAGQISVGWYDHGPNPNDGHMAMTLSDGRNAESGGSSGVFTIGGSAAGAGSPQFDQHMHLPTVYGEGPAGSSSASSPFTGGSAAAAATGAAPTGSGGGGAAPASSSGGGGSISIPSSFSGLATMGLDGLGVKTKVTPDSPERTFEFGKAASAAVSGQIDSALGVFGVNGSPGWLKGISQLVGAISIGGGGSANPLSAAPGGAGVPAPGDAANMHGTRGGQAPGPTYNVYARDAEGALDLLKQREDRITSAKLDHIS